MEQAHFSYGKFHSVRKCCTLLIFLLTVSEYSTTKMKGKGRLCLPTRYKKRTFTSLFIPLHIQTREWPHSEHHSTYPQTGLQYYLERNPIYLQNQFAPKSRSRSRLVLPLSTNTWGCPPRLSDHRLAVSTVWRFHMQRIAGVVPGTNSPVQDMWCLCGHRSNHEAHMSPNLKESACHLYYTHLSKPWTWCGIDQEWFEQIRHELSFVFTRIEVCEHGTELLKCLVQSS